MNAIFEKGKEEYVSLILIDQPKNWDLTLSFFLNNIYENYNVNTPPFMAGMKRYPLKSY